MRKQEVVERIEPRPEFAKILRVVDSYATGDGSFADRINGSFDRLVAQSGTGVAPGVVLRLCLLGAIICGGSVFVAMENVLFTAIFALAGATVPVVVLIVIRARRQAELHTQLPQILDRLARTARTGRNLPDCLEFVAADAPSPLGDEIACVVRRVQMGISLDDAVGDLPERTGVADLSMLVAALSLSDRAHGGFPRILDRFAAKILANREPIKRSVRPATSAF